MWLFITKKVPRNKNIADNMQATVLLYHIEPHNKPQNTQQLYLSG